VNEARAVAARVIDPELRVVTIEELGILREVSVGDDGGVLVTITPTYAGCPAMDTIRADIGAALRSAGYRRVEIVTALAPAWTTDWISESGRAKLAAAQIVPPGPAPRPGGCDRPGARGAVRLTLSVRCPRCGSPDTEQLSRFGSTACKALWRCRQCVEPFEHLKAL
jgi:ring-1,2-phenylacetyl-CoA epoxidase subunit PaaD